MKIQVTQENLNKALGNVCRVANTRSTLPILSNILLKTSDNRLSISATNLDLAISQLIGSKVNKEGSITVPARLMQDFIASLPPGVIDLNLKDNKLYINTETYRSVINGISAEEFPVMPAINKGQSLEVSAKDFKQGLSQVISAASSDETRPVLTGVYIHNHDGQLYMVATDSYRLAEKVVTKNQQPINILVPAAALQDLLRIISDQDDVVEMVYDEQQVRFKVGEVELVSRQIDGQYPDYRKLIPKKFAHNAQLSRTDFTSITKVSSLFARETAGSVTINLDAAAKQVSIRSIASQLGENTANAKAEVNSDSNITLNSRYILDALSCFNGDSINLAFNGKLEPCVLRDPETKDYLHVIMPLKS